MLGNERGAAMVVVLGLMILLSVMVAALLTAGNMAARARINVWNQEEARLAAQAGVSRMIFEAERMMTNNGNSNESYPVSDLTIPPDNTTPPRRLLKNSLFFCCFRWRPVFRTGPHS